MFGTLRILLLGLAFGSFVKPAGAQEPIRFARTPDISPDGNLVAFSYLGDIWVVETIGGTARPVTSHPAHDINPVFSPDGHSIAFSSNRHGSYDVFVVSVHGGRPKRVTTDSSIDMVCGWSPDGRQILFASTRGTDYPSGYDLYSVPATGGRARRITRLEGKEGVFSPSGDRIAYVRGPGTWYRKGYRGSSNDDVWICQADGSRNRRLTQFKGQDASPMWGPDGKTVYYVSECFGTPANLVRIPADGPGPAPDVVKPEPITFHREDSVRRARISANGEWIVYECGPDLWVVSTHGGAPRKLAIEAYADDKSNPEEIKTFSAGATEMALTADEKQIAFAVHGKLFRMPVAPRAKVTQLTDGPSNDHGIAWAPDGSKMLFLSDRDGQEDVYLLEQDDPEHPKFAEAHKYKVTRLTNSPDPEAGLTFSPDGKRVAFLRSGKLWTMKADGTAARAIVPETQVFDYDWSPDGKWIVYARRDGSYASELYIIPSTGPTATDPARNVTRYATYNGDVTWSANGKMLCFLSDRRGEANVFVLPLQKPAAPNYTERPWDAAMDWEDIHLRAQSVASVSAATATISPDASRVAYRDLQDGELWVASTSGHQINRLTSGHQRPRQILWSRRRTAFGLGSELLYYLDGAGQIHMARVTSSGGETVQLPFRIKLTVRTEEVYAEMFDQSWRYLAEHFYDAKLNGLDWNAIRAKYRPLVKHVAMKEDLYALLYLMLGELNASHLGVRGYSQPPDEQTAELGLIFDDAYTGAGLKIKEVLKRGPCDRRGISLFPGDLVLAIDGVEVTPNASLSSLLNGKVGEMVVLQVATSPTTPPRERRRFEVQASDRYHIQELMYERWVAHNAARVAELSKGKLGYIHIPSMDEFGLDRFVRSLYSDNFDKEAIVLDVRYNGGGYTHDKVLDYLGGREHTYFRQRDGEQGMVLRSTDRKWTRPVVLLINNRSFSDAEIFPSAFRTLGLGKLVGEPTGGFVIGTYSVPLIDGSEFRIPRTGVFTAKGVNMEKEGVQPDLLVEPNPDDLAQGVDAQLDKAVEVLQADVLAWKKSRGPQGTAAPDLASRRSSSKPSAAAPLVPAPTIRR